MRAFTLIELLIVMAIIGVIAAIGIPGFQVYRARAFDASAQSDLRNAANAEEVNFAVFESYLTCTSALICTATLPGLPQFSPGVALYMDAPPGSYFTGHSAHTKGLRAWEWDSRNGGLQP